MRLLADLTVRSSVILMIGLVAGALLRRRSAALRHFVLAAAIAAAGAVIPLNLILPSWDLPAIARSGAARVVPHGHPGPAAAGSGPDSGQAPAPQRRRAELVAGRDVDDGELKGGPSSTLETIATVIPAVWAGGAFVSAIVLLSGFARLVRIGARAERVRRGPWVQTVNEVSAAYGLRRRIAILQTDAPGLLATWGVVRPRVLLPAHAREWSGDRMRVVLCHELAHIGRHDWAVQIGAEALRTIYWFNPLMWMTCARLRRDSEQACDDVVLDAGVPSRDYAAHLLELARMCRRPGPTWASVTPIARPSTLERRIAAMLNPGLDRKALSRRAAALTAVLLLGITLPAAAFRAGQNALRPLEGSIYDVSGAVLPGVELKLQDAGQIKWQATTDAAGRFEFPPVQNGHYVLEAGLPGFRQLRHEFDLVNARDWDRAITLQVGDLRESINVRAQRTSAPAAATAAAPQRIRVGGNIRAPRKLHDVHPVYPKTMSDAGREGVVPIEAVIGRDGTVQSLRVLSANVHPDFAIAAVDAVRQWLFDPTLLNGVPVDVVMTVTVAFTLSE